MAHPGPYRRVIVLGAQQGEQQRPSERLRGVANKLISRVPTPSA